MADVGKWGGEMKLKPCPACDKHHVYVEFWILENGKPAWMVYCEDCKISVTARKRTDAIEKWNDICDELEKQSEVGE